MSARLVPLLDAHVLADGWRQLAATALEPNPFAEPEFALPAARRIEGGADASLLVVEDDLGMLFALPVSRTRSYGRVPVPAVTTWMHDYCFLGTPLISPRADASTVREALSQLRVSRSAPRLVLPGLPTGGPVADLLTEALRGWTQPVREPGPRRAVLHRRAEPDYLDASVSSSRRSQLRRKRSRLAESLGGTLRVLDRAQSPQDVASAVDEFLRLEASGWKGESGSATAMACRPGHAEFFREMCQGFAADGRLSMLTLGTVDKAVAMICGLLAGPAHFRFKVAYDDSAARRSPGLLLDVALVEHFHADLRLEWLDSCSDGEDSPSAQLYPDRRDSEALLVPLRGLTGLVATRGHPAAQRSKRRLAAARHLAHRARTRPTPPR